MTLIFLITGCSNNKYVYWCGDHACVNKKEKNDYFAEKMIVELRDIKKNKNTKEIKKKIIKEQKEKLINKKNKIKKQKEIEKVAKKKKKENLIKSKSSKKVKIKKEEVIVTNTSNLSKEFDQIKRNILDKNKSKDFPDINDISN